MKAGDLLILHRRWCQGCDSCEHAAEARKADQEEPLNPWEEAALDTWAERCGL